MAFFQSSFFSNELGINVGVNVIIPQKYTEHIGSSSGCIDGEIPVLYLLHGLSDDHSIWMRMTSIERYATETGIAVVMPAVNRSFYTDMKHGYKYWTYLSQELPALIEQFFPIRHSRNKTMVAGLSMGGYGAMKLALTYPERFCAAASFSGVLDIKAYQRQTQSDPVRKNEWVQIFGQDHELKYDDIDLMRLVDRALADHKKLPYLFQTCGTEDFLYSHNQTFRDYLQKKNVPLDYFEASGGHEWRFWDDSIERFLNKESIVNLLSS